MAQHWKQYRSPPSSCFLCGSRLHWVVDPPHLYFCWAWSRSKNHLYSYSLRKLKTWLQVIKTPLNIQIIIITRCYIKGRPHCYTLLYLLTLVLALVLPCKWPIHRGQRTALTGGETYLLSLIKHPAEYLHNRKRVEDEKILPLWSSSEWTGKVEENRLYYGTFSARWSVLCRFTCLHLSVSRGSACFGLYGWGF